MGLGLGLIYEGMTLRYDAAPVFAVMTLMLRCIGLLTFPDTVANSVNQGCEFLESPISNLAQLSSLKSQVSEPRRHLCNSIFFFWEGGAIPSVLQTFLIFYSQTFQLIRIDSPLGTYSVLPSASWPF